MQKFIKKQNIGHLNVLKRQILNFYNPQNWFHVKSEWQKYSKISTLCRVAILWYHFFPLQSHCAMCSLPSCIIWYILNIKSPAKWWYYGNPDHYYTGYPTRQLPTSLHSFPGSLYCYLARCTLRIIHMTSKYVGYQWKVVSI